MGKHRHKTCDVCGTLVSGGKLARHLLIHYREPLRARRGEGSAHLSKPCPICTQDINHGKLYAHVRKFHGVEPNSKEGHAAFMLPIAEPSGQIGPKVRL